MKLEPKILEDRKNSIEIRFSEKSFPNALLDKLHNSGIDAYVYEPHPLLNEIRLRIEATEPKKELKKVIKDVKKGWREFNRLLMKELGPVKSNRKTSTTKTRDK